MTIGKKLPTTEIGLRCLLDTSYPVDYVGLNYETKIGFVSK